MLACGYMEISIYSRGIAYCSVCVPKGMKRSAIKREVNMQNPTGIKSQWEISKEDFSDGSKNPHECEDDKNKQHYLFVC